MLLELALIAAATLSMSAALTGLARKVAASYGVLDVPNKRSSHSTPTPRGGGVSIVLAANVALVALALLGILRLDLFLPLIVGGGTVAIVGFVDDRRRLSARVRLAVHVAAAASALAWLGGLPAVTVAGHMVSFGWAGYLLGSLGIIWTLNLFNFMDGIDGIAASEAVFVVWGAAMLAFIAGTSGPVPAASLVFGAACGGFLLWNWPPAKIFMGDVGSGYIGYTVAVLAVAAARESPVALFAWLILGGAFFVDATVTLVLRLLRGERVHEAHRSHAYQWLARRWGSHRRVTLVFMTVNVLWLLPCAALAMLHPHYAAVMVVVALTPLVAVSLVAGAGRREDVIPREA